MSGKPEGLEQVSSITLGSTTCVLWAAQDGMTAYLDCQEVSDSASAEINEENLLEALKNHLSADLIDTSALSQTTANLHQGQKIEMLQIASGTPITAPQDGKFEPAINAVTAIAEGDACTIEPVSVKTLDTVSGGQVVGTLHPPKQGKDGIDVRGKTVPAPKPQPAPKITIDKTVETKKRADDSELTDYIAKEDGYLFEVAGRLCVRKDIIVDGNIDVTCGDLDLPGSVRIRGNITKGFLVQAVDDIRVEGNIYGGSLISLEGGIRIQGFVAGENESRIIAGGGIHAEMVQEAALEATSDIEIEKEARDVSLRTRGAVLMPSGHLFGGQVHSRFGIEAVKIGSSGGSNTKINMLQEVRSSKEYAELAKRVREHEQIAAKYKNKLGAIADFSDEQIEEDNDLKPMLPAVQAYRQVMASKNSLEAEMEALLEKERERIDFRVNYLSELHPGVVIRVGKESFSLSSIFEGPGTIKFLPTKNTFLTMELSPMPKRDQKAKS